MADTTQKTGFEHLSNEEFHDLEREHRDSAKNGTADPTFLERLRAEHKTRASHGVGLAGDIVGDVAHGLGGKSNPVGGILHTVSKGLNRGAGKEI